MVARRIGSLFRGKTEAVPLNSNVVRTAFWGLLVFFIYKMLRNTWSLKSLQARSESDEGISLGEFQPRLRRAVGVEQGRREKGSWRSRFLLVRVSFWPKFSSLFTSPQPFIDVFTISTAACDYFHLGINPYAQSYPDIYRGAYWVHTHLSLLARGVASSDVVLVGSWRHSFYVHLGRFSDGGRSHFDFKISAMAKGDCASGAAFVAEFSGHVVRFGSGVDRYTSRHGFNRFHRPVSEGTLDIGRSCARLFLLDETVLGIFRRFDNIDVVCTSVSRKESILESGLAAAASFVLLMLPFVLWDWDAFYQSTIGEFLTMPMRPDALTVIAGIRQNMGWLFPASWSAIIYIVALGGSSLFLWKNIVTSKQALLPWSIALVLIYGVTFLFGKQAFCNYYYLLAYFVLIHMIVASAQGNHGDSV